MFPSVMSISIPDRSTNHAQPRTGITVLWKKDCSSNDIDAARELIGRVHYQDGKVDGGFIIAFADLDEIRIIAPEFASSASSGNICVVGAAIIKPGMTHGNPTGRRDLAEKCFLGLKLEKLRRDQIVRQMGLALISRVAVEPQLHGYGIGRVLAKECRKRAVSVVPGSQYVEVMTSQRLSDAQKYLKTENAGRDFLQAAGFRLAPFYTKIAKHRRRDRRDCSLYYWAPAIA
jgi:hypothetical protein